MKRFTFFILFNFSLISLFAQDLIPLRILESINQFGLERLTCKDGIIFKYNNDSLIISGTTSGNCG